MKSHQVRRGLRDNQVIPHLELRIIHSTRILPTQKAASGDPPTHTLSEAPSHELYCQESISPAILPPAHTLTSSQVLPLCDNMLPRKFIVLFSCLWVSNAQKRFTA